MFCVMFPSEIAGSSPRGRGTRWKVGVEGGLIRFIPARAGNTRMFWKVRNFSSVHPRAGGEHYTSTERLDCVRGSSPRGRGTPVSPASVSPLRRFIPARAGNTRRQGCGAPWSPVHPRAGGEHGPEDDPYRPTSGSSPRGRGTPDQSRKRNAIKTVHPPRGRGTRRPFRRRGAPPRFIPARAGNTRSPENPTCPPTVHPRAGGEHLLTPTRVAQLPGSSPRGRGTRPVHGPLQPMHRFIPARAGNTGCRGCPGSQFAVHPRAGGEHSASDFLPGFVFGSSPRGRGTRVDRGSAHRPIRFIPARAGNTTLAAAISMRLSVHPRAGGEHRPPEARPALCVGSSPRGRGTREPRRGLARVHRFIPARAGNTRAPSARCAALSVHPRAGGEHKSAAS